MLIWNSLRDIPVDLAGTAVTIGKYDAIHLGHRALLNDLVDMAEEHALTSVVVTFRQHPFELLRPNEAPLPIIGPHQKEFQIREAGVDAILYLDFDQELASLTPEQFVQSILADALHAKYVMVGQGFVFGSNASGDCETLAGFAKQYGFSFKSVERYQLDGKVISTTSIRQALDRGDIQGANRLLGRPHTTTGVVQHGLKIGREIGFPTANIDRQAEGYLPLDGVYAGWLHVNGQRYPTAISIGINETFQAVPRLAEAHIIDHTGLDLYDKLVTLEYVEFVRPAAKFNGVEDLVAEIKRDLDKIRNILAN